MARRLLPAALLLLANPASAAATFTVADLMRMLAAVPASHTTFEEERTVTQLTTPVHDSGTLDYVRPARLEKHTIEPRDERLVVDGEKLWIVRAGQPTRNLDLDDQPEIAALVDTVRGTLAGDFPALQKSFHVSLTGDAAAWQLTLEPADARVARFLRVVHIGGSGSAVTAIETIETGGNTSRMTIGP